MITIQHRLLFILFVFASACNSVSNLEEKTGLGGSFGDLSGGSGGAQPEISASPSPYNFGNLATGSNAQQTFLVANSSSASAVLQTTMITGSGFIVISNSCNSIVLAPAANCSVTVRFSPTSLGSANGSLTIPYLTTSGVAKTHTVVLGGTGISPTVGFAFNGFTGDASMDTSSLTASGVALNWTPQATASYYKIFITSGSTTSQLVRLDNTSLGTYYVTGLTPNSTYSFRINAYDGFDVSDGNTQTVSITTLNTTGATFNGWSDVVSVGSTVTHATSIIPGLTTELTTSLSTPGETAHTAISWEEFTFLPSGVATAYRIYRGQGTAPSWPSGFTFIGLAGVDRKYIDTSVSMNETYHYRIHPVVGASTELTPASTTDSTIKVNVPPENMVLVHRWIANREMCVNTLGKTWPADIDRSNNYRCAYRWGLDANDNILFGPSIPLNDHYYWDLKSSLIVDRFGNGCNITTTGPQTGIDADPDNSTGSDGDVYYRRSTSNYNWDFNRFCKKKISGTWRDLTTSRFSAIGFESMATNEPGFPALVVGQSQAADVCSSRGMRLPRLYEASALRAPEGDFVNPSAGAEFFINNGYDHPTNGSCNVRNGDSTPGTNLGFYYSPNYPKFMTGSWGTRNCQSRYKMQDVGGNFSWWTSDQMVECTTAFSYHCKGIVSTLDAGNNMIENFKLDGILGVDFSRWGGVYYLGGTNVPMIPFLGLPTQSVDSNLGGRNIFVPVDISLGSSWPDGHVGLEGIVVGGHHYQPVLERGQPVSRHFWRPVQIDLQDHRHQDSSFYCVKEVTP